MCTVVRRCSDCRSACETPGKMTKWPWLTTINLLALINTIQWSNSIALHRTSHDYNSYWEEHLWSARKYHHSLVKRSSVNKNNTTPTTTSRNCTEDQKIEPRNIIKPTSSVRALPTSNQTKSLVKNAYPTNNSSITSNGLKSPQTKAPSGIVFPTDIVKDNLPIYSINKLIPEPRVIEKCSMNGSFCTKVDNYPRQDLIHLFRTSKFMSSTFFSIDSISETNDLETRISNSNANLQSFCDSLEEVIFPEAGLNKNNEWRYIIQDPNNDNNNFKQGIKVEKCLNAGEPCKFNGHLPIGHTTTCIQKYIYRKLVAMKDSNEIYYENFKLPSCCACMYSVNTDLLTRIGGDPENSSQTGKNAKKKN